MALNRFMHPRNVYKDSPPDFKQLAIEYPELAPFLIHREDPGTSGASGTQLASTLDFENPAALRALTRALLLRDFKLDVEMPLNKLIPTVPSRLNYILWIEDLLAAHGLAEDPEKVLGLDVGAGASCVYPLLGARKNGWSFVTTETDEEAFTFANENVLRNGLSGKIVVLKPVGSSYLQSVVEETGKDFHFCMSNPPFFQSQAERDEKASYKPAKLAANPVAVSDAVVEGGEVAFVSQMIEESLLLQNKIKIYSSMLGKKSSLTPLKTLLQTKNLHFTTTEFCQGRTMRWGLAWSTSLNLEQVPLASPRTCSRTQERSLSYDIDFGPQSETDRMKICLALLRLLQEDLKMYVVSEKSGKERSKWRVSATENTWAHQRRKRREKLQSAINQMEHVSVQESVDEEMVMMVVEPVGKIEKEWKYLIQFFLVMKNDPYLFSFELTWVDGERRDSLHEIVCFIKNHVKEPF